MPISTNPVGGGIVERVQSTLKTRQVSRANFIKKTNWSSAAAKMLYESGVALPSLLVSGLPDISALTGISRSDLLQAIVPMAVTNPKEVLTRLLVETMGKGGLTPRDVARLMKVDVEQVNDLLRGAAPSMNTIRKISSWLEIDEQQVAKLAVAQQSRKIAPTMQDYVPPLSELIIQACLDETERARQDFARNRVSRSSATRTGSSAQNKAEAAAAARVRIKEFSPSSWAKKHHFAVRVISSLAAGRTITFRSKQYGSRLAGVLGISNETFWAAMRRNCEMPANAWSGIIQKRLQDAFESDATYGKGENGEKVKVLPTRKEFAAKVGVRYDTLFRLIGTGDIGVVQFVNREKIRRFLNMDHKTWNEAIQRKPDNRQTLIGVLGKRNAAVSRGSLASGDDEIRLLSLWRKIQGGPNAKRNCDMLFGVLNKCLRSARNSTKTGT